MAVKSFTIENFKCIRDPIKIDLKPITLLFGTNSAGKSTIIQALHYAWEIFERGNVDPDKTLVGGKSVDLGGFKNILYNNDLTRYISLRFDLDWGGYGLPIYGEYEDLLELEEFGDPISFMEDIWVKIVIKWSSKLNEPVIESYEVGANNELLARIIASENKKVVYFDFFNFDHPIFYDHTEYEKVKTPPQRHWYWAGDRIALKEALKDNNKLQLHNQKIVLPQWGSVLDIRRDEILTEKEPFEVNNHFTTQVVAELYLIMISSMVVGPGHLVQNFLSNMRYIGPLRELPQRNYYTPLSPDKSRWASGIAAWDIFHGDDNKLVENTNKWLAHENHLNSDYKVEVKSYKELPEETNIMKILSDDHSPENREKAKQLLLNLPAKKQVFLLDQRRNILVKPQDVGTGISQILPVIVGALNLESGMMVVEQPELHIHPAFQVAIGDLFVSQINNRRIKFLLETHSEHLMLRFLRRIRETGNNELSDEKYKLTPEKIVIHFVETDENGMKLTSIHIDKEGEFIDQWPKGFFEEREDELLY